MRQYLRLLSYLKPYKHLVIVSSGLSFLLLALEGVSAWVGAGFIQQLISKQAIDFGGGQSGFFLVTWLDSITKKILLRPEPYESLIAGTALLILVRLLIVGVRYSKLFMLTAINQRVLSQVRHELFERLTGTEISFTQKVRPGEIATIFANDVDQLNGAIVDAIDRIVLHPLQLIFALALMGSISFSTSAFVLILLLTVGLCIHLVGGYIQHLSRRGMEIVSSMQAQLIEYCSGVILARLFNREPYERTVFGKTSDDIGKMTTKLVLTRNLAPQLSELILIIGGGILLLTLGRKVLVQETMSVADMLRIAMLLPMASSSMEALSTLYARVRQSLASVKRVFSIMDLEIARPDPPDAILPPPFSDRIEFSKVSYVVDNRAIVNNLTFSIPKGAKVVVYGPSGSGKTTLLGLLAGYLDSTGGSIRIDGNDIVRLNRTEWRKQLAMVQQIPFLLNGTVLDNLRYVKPDGTREQFLRALESALLSQDQLSVGLDTPVGNCGERLSGGERQRLTIARALLNEPSVLLMDEPTSMLDEENRLKLRDSILSAATNRTLVLVTHDPLLREIADIELRLSEGQIAWTRPER